MAGKADEELVVAAMSGDVDSFVTLCHRYYAALVTVARAVLRDGHLAEDAAQETLAKACRRLECLTDPRRFGAWLMTICRNEATDMLRRIPKTEDLGGRDVAQDAPEDNSDVVAVRQAMDLLPVESRELLYLRYRSELTYEEIAALLATTPEAVHGRLRRAKEALKAHMERQQDRRLS